MENINNKRQEIVSTLESKAVTKQIIYKNTLNVFNLLKDNLSEMEDYFIENGPDRSTNVEISYHNRSEFEVEFKLAGDLLIFNMHSNVFYFDKTHFIWRNSYTKADPMRAYCGMISIYNFLSDSFKYNRSNDLGHLVARIFINKDMHYFVEGTKQIGYSYNDFANSIMDKDAMNHILENSMQFCMDFDLMVNPYENVREITVEEMKYRIDNMKMRTGKTLGFKFSNENESLKKF